MTFCHTVQKGERESLRVSETIFKVVRCSEKLIKREVGGTDLRKEDGGLTNLNEPLFHFSCANKGMLFLSFFHLV